MLWGRRERFSSRGTGSGRGTPPAHERAIIAADEQPTAHGAGEGSHSCSYELVALMDGGQSIERTRPSGGIADLSNI